MHPRRFQAAGCTGSNTSFCTSSAGRQYRAVRSHDVQDAAGLSDPVQPFVQTVRFGVPRACRPVAFNEIAESVSQNAYEFGR